MTFRIDCWACGHSIDLPGDHPGDEVTCPSCRAPNSVPAAFTADGLSALNELAKRPGVITAIATLNFLSGIFSILLGGFWWFGVFLEAPTVDARIGYFYLALFWSALGTVQVAAAVGLWKLRPFGRRLQIILSIVGLIAIPVGTLISALILYYLYRPGVKILFSGKAPSDLLPEQRAGLEKVAGSGAPAVAAVIIIVVVSFFICGIFSSIAIPSFLESLNRGRQKRAITDIRVIANAIENYQSDHGLYPAGLRSVQDLEGLVVPTYLPTIPVNDGWRKPYLVFSSDDGSSYSIMSFGRDRIQGAYRGGATVDADADIVLENDIFVQWPEEIDID